MISNGTAVLGLGDIGPWAGKPVMEGKGVLFKKFADIDVFDLNINAKEVDHFCTVVKALEPTFGGINLEDIKAPECFVIEERLQKEMEIPVFHDDQHGTAIISGAALLNAVELGRQEAHRRRAGGGVGGRRLGHRLHQLLGAAGRHARERDDGGHQGCACIPGAPRASTSGRRPTCGRRRAALWPTRWRAPTSSWAARSKGVVTPEMVKTMAKRPIIFALANPDPEIGYLEAKEARPDAIVATGRSDYPNQVNNVLGFPFIFRGRSRRARPAHQRGDEAGRGPRPGRSGAGGRARRGVPRLWRRALRVRARVHHPQAVRPPGAAVGGAGGGQGGDGDGRGAATRSTSRPTASGCYKMQSRSHQVMATVFEKARQKMTRIVLDDGEHPRVLQAAHILREEGLCEPMLLGNRARSKRPSWLTSWR